MTHLLLIDDETATRLVMASRLKEAGFEVTSAESGAQGIALARETRFDMIVVDAVLKSGIGGVENISLSGFGTAFYAAIAHGDFNDWVGIDNITYTEVPAPGALALVGLAGVFAGRRRR